MSKRQWKELIGVVEDKKHILAIKIHYEDTDFSGYVYHTGYLRFCERSRSDFLSLLQITQFSHENTIDDNSLNIGNHGILFVVKSIHAHFLKPAKMDDIIEVETGFTYRKGIRIGINHKIMRGDDCLFTADIEITTINEKGKPARLPQPISKLFDYYIEKILLIITYLIFKIPQYCSKP